jgi:uncharacterized protein involved in outer membrane biogenesis
MRWRRIAFWFSFSVLALIVIALSWLWAADLGVFKPQLERYITEEFGHEFTIDGEFHVDLSRHTTVIAEDLRFANAPWAEADDMITVGRVEVQIDLWSLSRGLVLIELLDVDDTSILLLNPGDTPPNWERPLQWFLEPSSVDLDLLFGVVDIDRAALRLESAERERPLNLAIERLDQSYREDSFLDLELRATLDGKKVAVDGAVGTWDALLSGKNFDFDLEAVLDTFEFSARGRIDDVANLLRPEFEFTAFGPDVDDLTRMLGLGEEGDGDIDLSGALTPAADGPLALTVKGNLGLTEIDAVGETRNLQDFAKMGLQLTASGPDFGRILRLAGIHQVRESPFMLKVDAESDSGIFVVNEATMVFAEAQFNGSSGPFAIGLTVDVRDDGVEVLNLDAKTTLGELHGSGRIGDPRTYIGSQFEVEARSDSLARTAEAYGVTDMPDKPIEVKGGAEYTSVGIRTMGLVTAIIGDVAASVDGLIALRSGAEGSDLAFAVKGANLEALVAEFSEPTGVPALPYDVGGKLKIGNDGYRFRDVSGSLGTTSIKADGLLVPADMIAGSHFDIHAQGAAFEELVAGLDDVDVRPGSFELSGKLAFQADAIKLTNVRLSRPAVDAQFDLAIGMLDEESRLDFDVRAGGRDVRDVIGRAGPFAAFEQPFAIEARGNLRGSLWTFDDLDASVGNATVTAAGDLEFADARAKTEFSLELNVPTLAALGTIDGRKFNDQPLSVTAHVTGGNGTLESDRLNIRIGDSDINATIVLRKADVPEIDIDMLSDRLVLRPFLEDVEEYDPEPTFDDGRLIPDIDMPFEALKKRNVSIDIRVGDLERRTLFMKDIEVSAEVLDGVLNISKARFKGRSGELLASATLDPMNGTGAASLQLVTRNFALGMIQKNDDFLMRGDIDINLRSTGTDLRTLLGNSTGVVFVNARGGRLANENPIVKAIYGDMLDEILTTINPFKKSDPYTDLECTIIPWAIDDGQLTDAPYGFVSTNKMRLVTKSSLNLKTEKIRIGIETTPKKIVSFSASELINPYIQVVGTLARPQLAVDEAGVLITGGVAVATGGLSLLAKGLWNRLSQSGDPCKEVSMAAIKELGGRFPDLQIEGISRIE